MARTGRDEKIERMNVLTSLFENTIPTSVTRKVYKAALIKAGCPLPTDKRLDKDIADGRREYYSRQRIPSNALDFLFRFAEDVLQQATNEGNKELMQKWHTRASEIARYAKPVEPPIAPRILTDNPYSEEE